MGRTAGERSWKNMDFLSLAGRLSKSVMTLEVTGNTISCRVVRRQRAPVYEWHR
jgi:hypothetical protein